MFYFVDMNRHYATQAQAPQWMVGGDSVAAGSASTMSFERQQCCGLRWQPPRDHDRGNAGMSHELYMWM